MGGLECRWRPTSFGLTTEYQRAVYEEFFILKHHGGWSFFEAYNLPVQLRRWFLERLVKEFEDEAKEMEKKVGSSGVYPEGTDVLGLSRNLNKINIRYSSCLNLKPNSI